MHVWKEREPDGAGTLCCLYNREVLNLLRILSGEMQSPKTGENLHWKKNALKVIYIFEMWPFLQWHKGNKDSEFKGLMSCWMYRIGLEIFYVFLLINWLWFEGIISSGYCLSAHGTGIWSGTSTSKAVVGLVGRSAERHKNSPLYQYLGAHSPMN